jgi:hypothetical protein
VVGRIDRTVPDVIGNEVMGYKVALCERDIATYGALLGVSVFFAFARRRMRPVPLCCSLLGLGDSSWMA